MPKPHYVPTEEDRNKFIKKEGNKWIINPHALEIMWGGDSRYWDVPGNVPNGDATKPVELKQVSWLEVTGKIELSKLKKGKNKVIFELLLKTDAFGWNYGPIYFTAQPGQEKQYIWRKADLSTKNPMQDFYIEVPFTVDDTDNNDKLLFGIYEVWTGRWKGGLVIKKVVIQPV